MKYKDIIVKNKIDGEYAIKTALSNEIIWLGGSDQFIIDGSESCLIFIDDSATGVVHGCIDVGSSENSSLILYGSAIGRIFGDGTAEAHDQSAVISVGVPDKPRKINLLDESVAVLGYSGMLSNLGMIDVVHAHNNSRVVVFRDAEIHAYDNAVVWVLGDGVEVYLHENARVIGDLDIGKQNKIHYRHTDEESISSLRESL